MFDFTFRKDNQSCYGCRHDCRQGHAPCATDLVYDIQWDFLNTALNSNMTWEEAAQYARVTGNFLVTWYSEEMPPCPLRYLEGILNAIVVVAFNHGRIETREELTDWFKKMEQDVLVSGVRATNIAPNLFELSHHAMLECSLCYWMQAAFAYDALEPNVCAGSIMQSNFYLGMAAGPKFAAELGLQDEHLTYVRTWEMPIKQEVTRVKRTVRCLR